MAGENKGGGEGARRLKGVFSRSGTDSGESGYLWFAKETDEGDISCSMLDRDNRATGEPEVMDRDTFLKTHTLEPELSYRLVAQRLNRGDEHLKNSEYHEAKIEYYGALNVDADNIRGMFGLGLCYLALDEIKNATYVFERLVDIEETFDERHKHLFNEFGIALRKKGLFAQAMRYYRRGLALSPADDHLYYNLARAGFENKDTEEAFENLRKALAIDPDNQTSLAFLGYLDRQGLAPKDEKKRKALEFFVKKAKAQAEAKAAQAQNGQGQKKR